jgi:hypothetical protein
MTVPWTTPDVEFSMDVEKKQFRRIGEEEKTETTVITLYRENKKKPGTFEDRACDYSDAGMSEYEMNAIIKSCVKKMNAANSTRIRVEGFTTYDWEKEKRAWGIDKIFLGKEVRSEGSRSYFPKKPFSPLPEL